MAGSLKAVNRALGPASILLAVVALLSLGVVFLTENTNHAAFGLRVEGTREDGFWFAEQGGTIDLRVISSDEVRVFLDGVEVLHRKAAARNRATRSEVNVEPGIHALRIEKARADQSVEIRSAPLGRDVEPMGPLFRESPSPGSLRFAAVARFAQGVAALAVPWFIALACLAGLFDPQRSTRALLALLLWGGLLRLECIVGSHWPDAPPSARALARIAGDLRPASWSYSFEPYEADPGSYARRAREMVGFYDATDREPFFIGLVRVFLPFVDGHDVAVSFASAFASVALVAGGFALARRVVGRRGAIAVPFFLATDQRIVVLGSQGWRDDTFAAGFVWSLVAFLHLAEEPSRSRGLLAGVVGAWPALTRLSTPTFTFPALVLVALRGNAAPRERLKASLIAGFTFAGFVTPFLLSCWMAFGDPLRAIRVHTVYYRATETGNMTGEMGGIASYLYQGRTLTERADTAAAGMMEVRFGGTFLGMESWSSEGFVHLATAACALGLVLMAFTWPEPGRALWLTLFATIPFAWTWHLGGGGHPRFNLYAMPVGVLAAVFAVCEMARLARRDSRRGAGKRLAVALLILALVFVGRFLLRTAHLLAEGRAGRTVVVTSEALNGLVMRGFGWPRALGALVVRASRDEARIRMDLPSRRPSTLTIRWWSAGNVSITENGRTLGVLPPVDKEAMGLMTLEIPASAETAREFRFEGDLDLWWVRFEPKESGSPR